MALVLAGMATATYAQDYPSRPVRVVVPFPPGGGADLHGRLLAERLGKLWNQQALIDNVSGAGGGVAAVNVARSRPDGYTVFFATHPIFAINPFIYDKLSTHIPYRGTAPAATALLANEIQMHFDGVYSAMSQMKAGRVRGIAITSLKRLPTLPDLPTMNESGLNGFEATLGYGLLLPAGTPSAVVAVLNRDANKVLREPAFKKQMQDQGIYLQGGTPEQFKAFLASERKKWGDLLKRLNIKAS